MLFLHAENLEQTELFFSSFCQKTVAVNQKNHREQANDINVINLKAEDIYSEMD